MNRATPPEEPGKANDTVSDKMKELATEFCAENVHWKFKLYKHDGIEIIRWVTCAQICLIDIQDLVWFLENHIEFKSRTLVFHTGSHITTQGKIGDEDPMKDL